jgi:hypothetical protein
LHAVNVKPPSQPELGAVLGPAYPLWIGIIRVVEESGAPLDCVWKPSKLGFGRMCLLQHKKRTLLYLIPEKEKIQIAIIFGERAYRLASTSTLPATIKKMFREAKPYAEGRGIRFAVSSSDDFPTIAKLIEIKTA